jgi:hypothetical protein
VRKQALGIVIGQHRRGQAITAVMFNVTRRTLHIGSATTAVWLAVAAFWTPGLGQASAAYTASRSIPVNERAQLRLNSRHSMLLYESGTFAGAPGGGISVQIELSYTQVKIWFSSTPHGGAISGSGHASFYAEGPVARFSGTVAVTHGTGHYAGASASALHISGALQRNTYAISLNVWGTIRL